ncbi:MAG: hypothetical protein AAF316_09230 [Cyanobacteria bacterium P01_A01_bin.80]
MLTDILPFSFSINSVTFASVSIWSLALYLGFSPVSEWIMHQLNRWFNFAERFLYMSESEFEKTRKARESQNAFYASVFSIVPFFIVSIFVNWGLEVGLGESWGISTAILALMGCGVYELGRRDGKKE